MHWLGQNYTSFWLPTLGQALPSEPLARYEPSSLALPHAGCICLLYCDIRDSCNEHLDPGLRATGNDTWPIALTQVSHPPLPANPETLECLTSHKTKTLIKLRHLVLFLYQLVLDAKVVGGGWRVGAGGGWLADLSHPQAQSIFCLSLTRSPHSPPICNAFSLALRGFTQE